MTQRMIWLSTGILSLFCSALFLTSCSSDLSKDEFEGQSAQQIYDQASKALKRGDYTNAVKDLEAVSAHYPFGSYAYAADLQVIYAYYKSREWTSAILSANRFIKLHPRHPHVDYAYYMKGKAKQEEGSSFLQRTFRLDPSKREPVHLREAFAFFKEMVERFPDSPYTPDAMANMITLRNVLAEYELYVARYYVKRHADVAALNRAKNIIIAFPETPSRQKALYLMSSLYQKLGMKDLADQTDRIIALNPPSST